MAPSEGPGGAPAGGVQAGQAMATDGRGPRTNPGARALLMAVGALVGLAYPLLLWFGLTHWTPEAVEWLVLGALSVAAWTRLRGAPRDLRWSVLQAPLAAIALVIVALALDNPRFLLALPALVNVSFLAAFASSLRGMPMVERYARVMRPGLTAAEARYCRTVTHVWCGFFAVNASLAAALAWYAPYDTWALYNGILSYAAMGALFGIEYLVRMKRFGHLIRRDAGHAADAGLGAQ